MTQVNKYGEIVAGETLLVNPETGERVCDMTDEEAIDLKIRWDGRAADIIEFVGRLDRHLIELGIQRNAKVIYGKSHNYEITLKNDTDWTKMHPVLELFTAEEKLEAYKPEHMETIPAVPEHEEFVQGKWAVKQTVEKLARRHGDEALAIVEAATFPGKTSGKLVEKLK